MKVKGRIAVIKISKKSEPKVLKDNAKNWLNDVIQKKTAGEKIRKTVYSRFNSNREIKETIIEESHGKCSYCESAMLAVSHGDIEHITPLDFDHTLAFEWMNLILSCTKCNHNKLIYFDLAEPLLNPVVDDPEKHLSTEGHWIRGIAKTKGPKTESKIELNRGALLEKRLEQLEILQQSIDLWKQLSLVKCPLMAIPRLQIESAQKRKSEYLFMKSQYIKKYCPELWKQII